MYQDKQMEQEELLARSRKYGTSSSARKLTEIVHDMIEREVYSKKMWKCDLIWDVDSLGEAINLACIQLGLSDEEYGSTIHDQGSEIEIQLY
jgi:hypothetical protein